MKNGILVYIRHLYRRSLTVLTLVRSEQRDCAQLSGRAQ
jgi:hypothetical protein